MQADELVKAREEQRKPVLDEGKKVNFFPLWKPQQGVVEEPEDEEEYLSLREDERPYIALRKKQEIRREEPRKPVLDEEKKEDFFPKWQPQMGVVEDNEEEEGNLTLGEDGRPYIALRKDKKEATKHLASNQEQRRQERRKSANTRL